jgi:hypothetical protein
MSFIDCQSGYYSNMTVTITDQNDRRVQILDPTMCILFVIKSKEQ